MEWNKYEQHYITIWLSNKQKTSANNNNTVTNRDYVLLINFHLLESVHESLSLKDEVYCATVRV